ncbi:MAG: hypothetical protein DRI83_05370 [Bacteroidetes bacterium]|nr:MAG: hypothetical protein DRI83_05370 [Bacteroidota bacterium]
MNYMKRTFTLLMLVFSMIFCNAQNLLNNPESIVYDAAADRYLVSNCGDGQIVAIASDGQQSYFNTDMTATLGLHLVGDTLYVSSNDGPYSGIVGMLLSSGDIVFHVDIPEKELLNDIASDNAGHLYVTDSEANKIFKVNIAGMSYTTLVDAGLGYPNGILYDETNNRLMVLNCLLASRPILSVDLDDLTLSTIVETGISAIDGFTEDNDGNYYFSSWTTDRVYRYDHLFTNPPEIIAGGYTDPADIYYNKTNDILAIPNFNADTIIFLPISPMGVDDPKPAEEGYIRIYPNPFTEMLNINFDLAASGFTKVSVYNAEGRLVDDLVKHYLNCGDHYINWESSNLEPGIYFLVVCGEGIYESKKLIKN